MNVVYKADIIDLQNELVEDLVEYLGLVLQGKILLFYSGGSALALYPLLFQKLSQLDFDFSRLTLAPVDERYGEASNYLEFKNLLVYEQLVLAGAEIVDTSDATKSLEETADWYDSWIKDSIESTKSSAGKVVCILGMGSDGHTSGIFPYSENPEYFQKTFVETERFVVGYDVGDKNPYKMRFTTTVPALVSMDAHFVYATGESKKEKLKDALVEGKMNDLPARVWQRFSEVSVYTDCEVN